MTLDFEVWKRDLTELIAMSLRDFRGRVEPQDEMAMFAVDCHPWNGVIVLALLTHAELAESPFLAEVGEMAAWKYYDFGASLDWWQRSLDIASRMRAAYEGSGDDRHRVADQFLALCANAVASKSVQDELLNYRLSEEFHITVPHPDSGKEYYLPR